MNAQALHNTTILVRFANPAAPGKKEATIRTTDGEYYGVAPKDFGLFQPGRRYKIGYTERDFQGRTYRTIKSCEPEEVVASAMPASSADRSAPPANATSELYFVTRCLAASISAGGVNHTREALASEGRLLAQVYRDVFGVA